MDGILLKICHERVSLEESVALCQHLRDNGFATIDVNFTRPAQVRMGIQDAHKKNKLVALIDVIDQYTADDSGNIQILGGCYSVLEIDEVGDATLCSIQEAMGIVATG